MEGIITEIYVTIDDVNYTKLDLYKDEPLIKKYKKLDLQKLSEVFAPFSKSFLFPATSKNRKAFGFFGDTDVIKINNKNKFKSKTYRNGILSNTGFIKLSNISYKNNKALNFTGSFSTNITNLKERIGEDLITDLANEGLTVSMASDSVQDMIKSEQTVIVDGVSVKYFVPLISNKRVWGFDDSEDSNLLDNVAYKENSDVNGNNFVKAEELRPCVSYSSIIDLIKIKYGINVISPIETKPEFLDLRVWCNSETFNNPKFQKLPILNDFGLLGSYGTRNAGGTPNNKKYSIECNKTTSFIKVTKDANAVPQWVEKGFRFRTNFNNVTVTGNKDNADVVIQYVKASNNVVLASGTFSLQDNSFSCEMLLQDSFFENNELEFYVSVRFTQPVTWASSEMRIFWRYFDGKTGAFSRTVKAWYFRDSLKNKTNNLLDADKIDLFKSLPKIKVIDFLKSHLKAFNISIYESSPGSELLYWLTPEDVNTKGNFYSKKQLDYTPYVTSKDYTKEIPNDYDVYNFKHAESDYFLNKSYLNQFNKEYGQILEPEIQDKEANEFKVETVFSILPPVKISGANELVTSYGFNNDSPSVIDSGEIRYEPNYNELTLFYSHGASNIRALGYLGVKTIKTGKLTYQNFKGITPLFTYIKVAPWSKNGLLFSFSALVFDNVTYNNTLYQRYYKEQTERLLNSNVLSHKFELKLPINGFRLQNDIIIGDNLFSIVEADIDETTGKTKITLLNY